MSPIGELRFTIMFDEFDKTFGGVFPSPIGELHFSIIIRLFKTIKTERFRPLSGSYISQSSFKGHSLQSSISRFRPLSGSYISQSGKVYHFWQTSPTFPSPIGELHFSIKAGIIRNDISSFRPLSGSYISQ